MRYLFYFVVLFFIYTCSVSGLCGDHGLKLGISATSFKSDVNCNYHDEPNNSLSYSNHSKYDAILVLNSSAVSSCAPTSAIKGGVRVNVSSFE